MEYISATEASEKWGVSLRQVQRLLAGGRIPRAKKYGRSWMIPADSEKPADPRREKKAKSPEESLSSKFTYVLETTIEAMPRHNPDAILKIANDGRARLQYEAELAYLRGDFGRAIRCCRQLEGDEAARLRASFVAVAAAVSLGDYDEYRKIESYLKRTANAGSGSDVSAVAQLALASVAVSAAAPKMVPAWLSNGDFSALLLQAKPQFTQYMLYLRAKYFLCAGQYESALLVAQTALAFCINERGIAFTDIYLHVLCALASHFLGRGDEAKRILLTTMRLALPHGFITPFAEPVSDFGGLIEECVGQTCPACYDPLIAQWRSTVKNWVSFHNRFTQDNLSTILSRREFYLAQLVARRVPYAEIAKKYGISVGRLKNIMLEIYEKLYVSGRDELAKLTGFYKNKGADA